MTPMDQRSQDLSYMRFRTSGAMSAGRGGRGGGREGEKHVGVGFDGKERRAGGETIFARTPAFTLDVFKDEEAAHTQHAIDDSPSTHTQTHQK